MALERYWADYGCVVMQPYHTELAAGTMNPATFLRCLGRKPWNVAYVEPVIRPLDGRYGENPFHFQHYYQYQVVLKPAPANVLDLYWASLEALGIDLRKHDIKFEEDNWEAPTLAAWGVGWQVMLDGLEITQFTYFQQCGGIDLDPICAELTYGMERITAFLQDVDSIYDIVWARDPATGEPVLYRDVRYQDELQMSVYNFERADVAALWSHFDSYEKECLDLLDGFRLIKTAPDDPQYRAIIGRFPILAAYELCLKCSHLFNLLDARGAISVTERVGIIARVRQLAVGVAKSYLRQHEVNAGNGHKTETVSA